MAKRRKLLYDTHEKRAKFVRKRGNIVTFKKPFKWKGEWFTQVMVHYLKKREGKVTIIGLARDSERYDSLDKLLDAIDWNTMESWHNADDVRD